MYGIMDKTNFLIGLEWDIVAKRSCFLIIFHGDVMENWMDMFQWWITATKQSQCPNSPTKHV